MPGEPPAMPAVAPASRTFPASQVSIPLPGVAAETLSAITHGLLAPVGVIVDVFYLFVRWLLSWGIARDSIFLPTYRGLVRNGSSGFSTKKVEFPASLSKRGGIFFCPVLFWLEAVRKSPSLPPGVLEILPKKIECS